MSNVAHQAKAHAEQEHQTEVKRGHPLNPNTVIEPVMIHPKNIFDNGPIHVRAEASGTGEDTYLDWSEPMTELLHRTRDLNEALLHRDPNAVRGALFQVEANVEALKLYLVAKDVIDGE
jgi:hypothetical protein